MKWSLAVISGLILFASAHSGAEQRGWSYYSDAAENWSVASNHPKVNGVVRRVDLSNHTVLIKHDEIPNLDMEAMTMTFAVSDPQMLHGITRGDRIRFSADEIGGVLTVVWLEKQ